MNGFNSKEYVKGGGMKKYLSLLVAICLLGCAGCYEWKPIIKIVTVAIYAETTQKTYIPVDFVKCGVVKEYMVGQYPAYMAYELGTTSSIFNEYFDIYVNPERKCGVYKKYGLWEDGDRVREGKLVEVE